MEILTENNTSCLATCKLPVYHAHLLFDSIFQRKFNTNIEQTKCMLTVSKAATELFPRGHTVLIQLCAVKLSSAAPLPSPLSAHPMSQRSCHRPARAWLWTAALRFPFGMFWPLNIYCKTCFPSNKQLHDSKFGICHCMSHFFKSLIAFS